MKYYLDTSALVKIYHREEGTDDVMNIYQGRSKIVISELAKVELLSAAHRKLREGEITEDALRILTDKFFEDIEFRYEVLKFSSLVVEEACRLLFRYAKTMALRSLDSLQLAFFQVYSGPEDIFVCSDDRLVRIAGYEGLKVMAP